MKKAYTTIAAMTLLTSVSTVAYAVDAPKPADAPMKHEMGMGMQHGMGMGEGQGMGMQHGMGMRGMGGGMHGMMAGMTDEQKTEHLKGMQEHMLKMHDLSNQILAEKDPAKKEQLKTQQLELMKAHHEEMMEKHHQMKMDHNMKEEPKAAAPIKIK